MQKLSRIIYYLTPYELKENTLIRPSGVFKLLTDEKDKQTFDILSEEIKKSIKFDDLWKIREYAINTALKNEEERYKNKELYYLEFGVFKGRGANFFANYVKKIYGFDSFEGLSEDWTGTLPKGSFNLNKKIPRLKKNVVPIKGLVSDTLVDFLNKHNPVINFVHMDLDLYKPTKFTLEKIKPFLSDGAIILFDELYNYVNWLEGEYKALNEVFDKEEYTFKAFRINCGQAIVQVNQK